MSYVTDYVVFEAGRRPRSWGMGLLYDAGEKPFDPSYSVFDGVTAYINPSLSQSLSFMAGYDVLQGLFDNEEKPSYFHQIFGAVSYDTIKLKGSSSFASNIGLYFSHMFDGGAKVDDGIPGSSVSFFDGYFAFLVRPLNLSWKTEALGVWGGVNPERALEFGARNSGIEEVFASFSVATQLSWSFLESGSYIGPKEFAKGDFKRHLLFFDFVYLPGSSEGALGSSERASGKATAFKANENFTKTLILFNGKPGLKKDSSISVDGIYDPYCMMNVFFYSLSYRYEDLSIGNIEARASYAMLAQTHEVKDKIGYKENGNNLGIEVDFSYSRSFGKDVTLGADLGMFIPGAGFTTDKEPVNIFIAQISAMFKL